MLNIQDAIRVEVADPFRVLAVRDYNEAAPNGIERLRAEVGLMERDNPAGYMERAEAAVQEIVRLVYPWLVEQPV